MNLNFSKLWVKKEAAVSVLINDLGFDLDYEYANAALVGEIAVDLVFSNVKYTKNDFEVSFSFPENIVLNWYSDTNLLLLLLLKIFWIVTKISNLVWQVHGLASSTETYHLPIHYKVNKKHRW